jgi:hypothetical protein
MRVRYGADWARVVARQNLELTRERDGERTRRTQLETRIANGALLEGETLERWKKLSKLGKTPEQILEILEAHPKLEAQARTASLNTLLDETAPGIGWTNAAAYRAAVARENLHIEKREEERDEMNAQGRPTGKKIKVAVPYARPADKADAPLVRLDQVESLKPFHAAFTQGRTTAAATTPAPADAPQPAWPATPATTPTPGVGDDPVAEFTRKRNESVSKRRDYLAEAQARRGGAPGVTFGSPEPASAPAGGEGAQGSGAHK